MKEADMLAAKIDLLMKRLDNRAIEKEAMKGTVQAMDSHMSVKSVEKSDIQGTTAPKSMKMPHISTTGSDSKVIMGETISPTRKEVIQTSIQITIRINLP
jgi:hypothetical protein